MIAEAVERWVRALPPDAVRLLTAYPEVTLRFALLVVVLVGLGAFAYMLTGVGSVSADR